MERKYFTTSQVQHRLVVFLNQYSLKIEKLVYKMGSVLGPCWCEKSYCLYVILLVQWYSMLANSPILVYLIVYRYILLP